MILFRYIFSKFFTILCAVLIALSLVVLLFDLIELLREVAKNDLTISFGNIVLMGLFKLPQMIYLLLPFVVLIAAIVFLFQFTKSSELIVMRAVGCSVWNFTFPMLLLVLSVGVFQVLVLNPLSSWMFRQYERMEEKWGFSSSSPFTFSEEGLWLRETSVDGSFVIRAGRIRQIEKEVFLDDVAVLKLQKDDTLSEFYHADTSDLKEGHLILKDANYMNVETEEKGIIAYKEFPTDFTLERILEKFDSPETMSFWRFPSFIKFLEESGFSTVAHRMYWHSLIAFPFFLTTMFFIAVVFALPTTTRQAKLLVRLILAILGGFIFYFLGRVLNVMGLSQTLPMVIAAWIPILIILPLCISAILHTEDG